MRTNTKNNIIGAAGVLYIIGNPITWISALIAASVLSLGGAFIVSEAIAYYSALINIAKIIWGPWALTLSFSVCLGVIAKFYQVAGEER